jgi:exodeoxyribonuclease VII small subunit
MEQSPTYEAAYTELEEIYTAINNEEVSIDELTMKVKRAAFLIEYCQAKLKNTEEEINKIVATMPQTGQKPAANLLPESSNPNEDDLPF